MQAGAITAGACRTGLSVIEAAGSRAEAAHALRERGIPFEAATPPQSEPDFVIDPSVALVRIVDGKRDAGVCPVCRRGVGRLVEHYWEAHAVRPARPSRSVHTPTGQTRVPGSRRDGRGHR